MNFDNLFISGNHGRPLSASETGSLATSRQFATEERCSPLALMNIRSSSCMTAARTISVTFSTLVTGTRQQASLQKRSARSPAGAAANISVASRVISRIFRNGTRQVFRLHMRLSLSHRLRTSKTNAARRLRWKYLPTSADVHFSLAVALPALSQSPLRRRLTR